MQEVELLRKTAVFKVLLAVVLVGIVGYLTFKFAVLWWHYLIGGVIALLIIGMAISAVEDYKSAFIERILKPLLKSNDLHFFPKEGFKEDEALSSNLFNFEYDDYDSHSLVVGKDFRLAYVEFTKEEEDEDSEGNIEIRTVTKFAGFLIFLKHNRFVRDYVLIEPSSFHLSDFLPVTYDKYRVKMDNPEFEKLFDVYSADQVEARYLLDHNYMELLIKLYKEADVKYLSFIKDLVFTKIEYDDFTQNIPLFEQINDKIIRKILFPVEYAIFLKESLNKGFYEG
ncbi:DUF3137 domain-containing protein [Nautilia lithotrophica]